MNLFSHEKRLPEMVRRSLAYTSGKDADRAEERLCEAAAVAGLTAVSPHWIGTTTTLGVAHVAIPSRSIAMRLVRYDRPTLEEKAARYWAERGWEVVHLQVADILAKKPAEIARDLKEFINDRCAKRRAADRAANKAGQRKDASVKGARHPQSEG